MARAARLALSTRDRGVNRHSLAGVGPVNRHAGELVPNTTGESRETSPVPPSAYQ